MLSSIIIISFSRAVYLDVSRAASESGTNVADENI